jgi:hypothetical protein
MREGMSNTIGDEIYVHIYIQQIQVQSQEQGKPREKSMEPKNSN